MKGVIRSEREGSAGVVRGTLSVILNECEGSITVVRKPVRRYPEWQILHSVPHFLFPVFLYGMFAPVQNDDLGKARH